MICFTFYFDFGGGITKIVLIEAKTTIQLNVMAIVGYVTLHKMQCGGW